VSHYFASLLMLLFFFGDNITQAATARHCFFEYYQQSYPRKLVWYPPHRSLHAGAAHIGCSDWQPRYSRWKTYHWSSGKSKSNATFTPNCYILRRKYNIQHLLVWQN
jgi:hypothetical protein